jgi:hypothetical protein
MISTIAEEKDHFERQEKRDAKKYRAHLTILAGQVRAYLAALDRVMNSGRTGDKLGREIAKLSNALEIENDKARYFGLGIDFRTDKKERAT